MLNLREDLHTHSTFSDGKGTLTENLAAARARGLERLGCVEHVRAATPWVAEYSNTVAALRAEAGLELVCGVEAKLLDQGGGLDLPAELPGVDRVYVADHQVPLGRAVWSPRHIADALRSRDVLPEAILAALVDAYVGAMRSVRNVVLAHPFSVLPKCGLSEESLDELSLERLLSAARRTGAVLEIDERWRCPSARVVHAARCFEVPVWTSTDAHQPQNIGVYEWAVTAHGASV